MGTQKAVVKTEMPYQKTILNNHMKVNLTHLDSESCNWQNDSV
jgi:hypothetical protein